MNSIKRLTQSQQGMTGLETAIILIAFVTIAAVFGYAVLSAGLFSAEQGKETIYQGLTEASSNIELSGSVVAKSTDLSRVSSIIFTVKNAPGGSPINITPCDGTVNATNTCVINLATAGTYLSNVKWTSSGDNQLNAGEQTDITLTLTDLGTGKIMSDNLTADTSFTVQVKPALGAAVTIKRTLPGNIDKIMNLN